MLNNTPPRGSRGTEPRTQGNNIAFNSRAFSTTRPPRGLPRCKTQPHHHTHDTPPGDEPQHQAECGGGTPGRGREPAKICSAQPTWPDGLVVDCAPRTPNTRVRFPAAAFLGVFFSFLANFPSNLSPTQPLFGPRVVVSRGQNTTGTGAETPRASET